MLSTESVFKTAFPEMLYSIGEEEFEDLIENQEYNQEVLELSGGEDSFDGEILEYVKLLLTSITVILKIKETFFKKEKNKDSIAEIMVDLNKSEEIPSWSQIEESDKKKIIKTVYNKLNGK